MKIAILSDIHSNIYAFRAVLNIIDKEKIKKVLIAGDLMGYYYWPKEVIEICMNKDKFLCIKGNHEENFLRAIQDDGYMLETTKIYGSSYKIALKTLSSRHINWLKSLPSFLNIIIDSKTFYITHQSLEGFDEYVYPDTSFNKLKKQIGNADYTVLGHTHYPFIFADNEKWLLNPGSVGQPRDHCASASFFIVDLKTNVIIPKRVNFELEDIFRHIDKYDKKLTYLKKVFQRG